MLNLKPIYKNLIKQGIFIINQIDTLNKTLI